MTTLSAATPAPATEAAPRPEHPAMSLLRAGVPLSLLLDLALPPVSSTIARDERADVSWVHRAA